MEINLNKSTAANTTVEQSNALLRSSFSWMGLALLLTTLTALLFASVPSLSELVATPTFTGYRLTGIGYLVAFSPLLFVMAISFGFEKMSLPVLGILFIAYSVITGMSLSTIFFVYKLDSIVNVFLSSSALFAIMAIAGYTTKTDLTKLGSLLIIGLVGICVAMLINFFLRSTQMGYVISVLGVIIFTGLTAYDVQKIKNLGLQTNGSTITGKLGIMGALTLYLDFINLFLFLLRLFGGRKN